MNANEHYVSQVLLRRFTIEGHFQRYDIDSGRWNRRSPSRVFSKFGYNQLIVDGKIDNTLEEAFSRIETHLPKTFRALDEAAMTDSTALAEGIYDNLCWYCAFLNRISPFAKAASPAEFLKQIDVELENGYADTLRNVLRFPKNVIQAFLDQHSLGRKIIIDSKDFLQAVYRIQFRLLYPVAYGMFRYNMKWTVCNSPIGLPLSDMAMFQCPVPSQRLVLYALPMGPKLLLEGTLQTGKQTNSSETVVRGRTLTLQQAECWRDLICLSAVKELISMHKIDNVLNARDRAKTRGFSFPQIVNPDEVMSAGTTDFKTRFGLIFVSDEEYVKFIHSFVQPPKPTNLV